MSKQTVYLKGDVYFEPLFNQWYAWPYLIPPVHAAQHINNNHKRIMKSFVKNYKLHILACKETTLTGGEFLNAQEDQVDDIKQLIENLEDKCADLIALSDALKQFEELIRNHKSGESIEYLYNKVPQPLKGYVEIFMDTNHHASYRLLEHLLYKSHYFKENLQSALFGSLSHVDERPFCFSTPRLADKNHLQLDLTFNSSELDSIFRSRTKGIDETELNAIIDATSSKGELDFRSLFSTTPPTHSYQPVDNGLRVRFFGHACFLLETHDVSVLIDPAIAVRGSNYADDVFSYTDLPEKIDYVCITHNHQDHFNFETLLQIRHKTANLVVPKNNGGTLADPSMKLIGQQLGFNVIEVDDFDEINIPQGRLMSLPFLGEHGDLNIRSKTVWYISLMGKTFFFGADATNCDPTMYQHIQKVIGDVDVLAIGMECIGAPYTWLYGALNTQVVSKNIRESRRLNGSDSKQAFTLVETFKPKQVFIYAMGMEPWYKYFMGIQYDHESKQTLEANKMIELCGGKGIPAECLSGKNEFNY